jgi:hypothetical protein
MWKGLWTEYGRNDLRKPEYYYKRFIIKKNIANYAQRWGGKNAIAIYQNYFYKFHYKENVLAEPRKSPAKSQGTTEQFEYPYSSGVHKQPLQQ